MNPNLNPQLRSSGLWVEFCFGCGEYWTTYKNGRFYHHKNPQTGEECVYSGALP